MNDNYSYTEYNEEKNKIPWGRIIISFLVLIAIIIIILLLIKSCGKANLRHDLVEAAKDYYEIYPELLPTEVGECLSVTLGDLEKEGLIKVSDYDACDKELTYVTVCYLESKTYHYSAILECGDDEQYGIWQDGDESDIDENSDIRYKFLGEELQTGTKYYYPNDATDATKVIEYYASIPKSGYTGKEDEQIGYKWYTEKNVNQYWNDGKYSSTQPDGYSMKGSSTTVTKYSVTKPSSASYREIVSATLYRTQSVARPFSWVCVNPNNPNDVVVSDKPCSGVHNKAEDIRFTCNGKDEVKVTAEQINNKDFPSCGDWSNYSTKACTTNYLTGVKCEKQSGYKYTDTQWKWYKNVTVKSYYPSGSNDAKNENTYYISSPTSGAIKDESSKNTVYKFYKLDEATTGESSYEEWLPITDGYVSLNEMLEAFRNKNYDVYSLSDINKIDNIRYQFKMQYRNIEN